MSDLYLLWNDSHIWGLLAQRAVASWHMPYRLVTAEQIAQGLLKSNPPKTLVVPGGNARCKAESLGEAGMQAIREYVHGGGFYLGFCGGAGLALAESGIGLCPWVRKPFANRLQHLVSGHLSAAVDTASDLVPDAFAQKGGTVNLPVWWPGRFEAQQNDVQILASYKTPAEDLWVADLALSALPASTFSDWEGLYGINFRPDFMTGQPSTIQGDYGDGEYLISYAHLETPASPDANRWLAHILSQKTGCTQCKATIPEWNLDALPVNFDHPTLRLCYQRLREIIALGMEHFLLFRRTPWLHGWRRGLPGLSVNALYALCVEIMHANPSEPAIAHAERKLDHIGQDFLSALDLFYEGVTGYLLAERLDMTLSHSPGSPGLTGLREQREALFGPPQRSGGLYGLLQAHLESIAFTVLQS